MDLIVILDSSSSVGRKVWPQEVEFASRLIDRLPVSPEETRVGIIDFSSSARVRVNLNHPDATSSKVIQKKLDKLKTDYRPGITFLDLALNKALQMYSEVKSTRHAGKLLIIITDGQASSRKARGVWRSAKYLMDRPRSLLKKMGVEIITIGVGRYIKKSELQYIASDRKRVLLVSNFTSLLLKIDSTLKKLCKSKYTDYP